MGGGCEQRQGCDEMFERMTERARRVVVLAQEEATRLGHDYVGTEHLLLGLLRLGDEPTTTTLLHSVGMDDFEAMYQTVVAAVGRSAESPTAAHIPLTTSVKAVLDQSLREALQTGDGQVGTEHLLLALLREHHDVGTTVLVELGADLDQLREAVLRQLRTRALPGSHQATRTPNSGDQLRNIEHLLQEIAVRLAAIERRLGEL